MVTRDGRHSVNLVPVGGPAGSERDYRIVVDGVEDAGFLAYVPEGGTVVGLRVSDGFRGRGVGRAALAAFFDDNPDVARVNGDSVPESHGFWESVGAEWQDGRDDRGPSLFELESDSFRA